MKLRVLFAAYAAIQFLSWAFLPTVVRADDDATWLKTKHRAYTGFNFGDGTIHSLSYDEKSVPNGKKDPTMTSHIRRAGLVYRIDSHYVKENETSSVGFTGNIFWYSDANGQTTKMGGTSLPITFANDLLWTDAIATLPWHYKETIQDRGASLAHVETKLATGLPIDIYVDTATGAYSRVIIDPHGDYREDIRIDEYAEPQPGLRIPSKFHYDGDDDAAYRDNFALNPLISDTDFQPPAPSARWSYGSSDPIPFDLTKYRMVIHVKVNGVDGRFLLDTGADSIYLTGDFARRAKISAIGHSEVASLYGTEKTDIGKATIQFGSNTLSDVNVYYGMRGGDDKEGPDGFMGYSLFASTNLHIDFDSKTLTIGDAPPATPADAVVLPASFGDGQPSIIMKLQSIPLDVVLDTGNPEGVVFPYHMLADYGIRLAEGKHGGGLYCGDLDPLTIGTFVYQSPYGCASYGSGRWVLAGLDFLRTFHSVDFDYLRGSVTFVPKKKP